MKRAIVILLVLLALAPHAAGCMCAFLVDFVSASSGALVVRGVVREYVYAIGHGQPIAMKVEIREVLQGRYAASEITIIGDFGMSCIPYVSNFPIGTEWVMAVHGPVAIRGLGDENFQPRECAVAFRRVKDGKVSGVMQGSAEPVSMKELRNLLSKQAQTIEKRRTH